MTAALKELKWTLVLLIIAAAIVAAAVLWLKRQAEDKLPSVDAIAKGIGDIRMGLPGALGAIVRGEVESNYRSPEWAAERKRLVDLELARKRAMAGG